MTGIRRTPSVGEAAGLRGPQARAEERRAAALASRAICRGGRARRRLVIASGEAEVVAYQIWCRVSEISPDEHLATVCVLPVEGGDAGAALRSESRVFPWPEVAQQECAKMAEAEKRRLEDHGYEVHSTEWV